MTTKAFKVCATCRIVLVHDAFGRWVHLQPIDLDHEPVPVDRSEVPRVVVRCDFCNISNADWAILSSDFQLPAGTGMSHGAWAACEMCGALVRRGRWDDLSMRVYNSLPEAMKPRSRSVLRETYVLLKRHMTGIVPLAEHEATLRAQSSGDTR